MSFSSPNGQPTLASNPPGVPVSQTASSSQIALGEGQANFPAEVENEAEGTLSRWRMATLSFVEGNVGLFLIMGSQLCFALMNVAVKLLNAIDPPVSAYELILVRMGITYILSMAYMLATKVPEPWVGPKGVRLMLVFRGFSGFFGLFGIYYSLQYLSLSDSTALSFLSPICVGIAGAIFLGERYSVAQGIASLLSLVGALLIARPSFLFDVNGDSVRLVVNEAIFTFVGPSTATPEQRLRAVGTALLGVLGATGAYISIAAMGKQIHPMHAMVSFSLQSVVVAATAMFATDTPLVIPTDMRWLGLLILIGVFGFIAQFLLTSGLLRESAGKGSIAIYTQIVFAIILERIFFNAQPSLMSITGIVIIVSSALYIAITKRRNVTKNSDMKREISEGDLEEGLLDGLLDAHAEEQDLEDRVGPQPPVPDHLRKGDDGDN